MKGLSLGFYEAELVKAVLPKSIFLKFCPFGLRSGDKTPMTLWCLIDTVRGTSTVMIKHQGSVKLLAQALLGSG